MGAVVVARMLDSLRTGAPTRDEAWEEVYRRHFADIHRVIWRCGVDPSEAEDLTQRVFVLAYERIDELKELTTVGGWLRGIALRVVSSHRRWRRVRKVKRWLVSSEAPRPAGTAAPDQELVAGRDAALVRDIVQSMKPRLRDVLVLCDMEGLAPAEAAKILGVPTNTVRSRRRVARELFGRSWRRARGGGHA